eukprot:PhM_4_TR2440/c2_g1_i4/m.12623
MRGHGVVHAGHVEVEVHEQAVGHQPRGVAVDLGVPRDRVRLRAGRDLVQHGARHDERGVERVAGFHGRRGEGRVRRDGTEGSHRVAAHLELDGDAHTEARVGRPVGAGVQQRRVQRLAAHVDRLGGLGEVHHTQRRRRARRRREVHQIDGVLISVERDVRGGSDGNGGRTFDVEVLDHEHTGAARGYADAQRRAELDDVDVRVVNGVALRHNPPRARHGVVARDVVHADGGVDVDVERLRVVASVEQEHDPEHDARGGVCTERRCGIDLRLGWVGDARRDEHQVPQHGHVVVHERHPVVDEGNRLPRQQLVLALVTRGQHREDVIPRCGADGAQHRQLATEKVEVADVERVVTSDNCTVGCVAL